MQRTRRGSPGAGVWLAAGFSRNASEKRTGRRDRPAGGRAVV
ncbi:hypothetical protein [Halorubrum sp. SD626R]|nr:hypothetical protein [Halorubrum sp. SD626R]